MKREDLTQLHMAKPSFDEWSVLVVDDQRDNLHVIEAALRFHGATVACACNGVEGLEVLKFFKPTLILLDLSMPIMDGWEMFEIVKSRPDLQDIPIIALTAHVMADDKERVLAAGFTGYIAKPFSVATVATEIQSIVQSAYV